MKREFLDFSLMVEVLMFSHRLVQWLSEALKDHPSLLGMRKVQGMYNFMMPFDAYVYILIP